MTTDILFIHPGNQKRIYQDLANEFTAIATPSWTALLADRARALGKNVAIYDVNVEGWDDALPAELYSKYAPELIVIMVYGHNPSASTQTMPAARLIVNDLKAYNSEIPIAMGGVHPSALPEKTLKEEKIDYVIIGEGVYTIPALSDCLSGKLCRKDVPGLCFRSNDGIERTSHATVVDDLDLELPDYAWDLLPDLTRYRAHNMHCFQYFEESAKSDFSDVRSPYVALNTSLGCPYSCHYCCINAIFDKPRIRYWSLDTVMGWFDQLVAEGVRNIRLDDELFILSPKRVENFCDLLIERNYDLNIWVYGRVDTIKDFLLKKMRAAGIRWICLGIESGNELVRGDVNKSIKGSIQDVVRKIQDNDIYVLGNYMFGLPEDTIATMQETLDLSIELNCEFSNFYTVMAFPGSNLYIDAVAKGFVPDSWQCFSQHSYNTSPLPTKHLKPEEVLKFRDEAFNKYFKNEVYLKTVEEKFGSKTRLHLEKMTEISIRRNLLDKQ